MRVPAKAEHSGLAVHITVIVTKKIQMDVIQSQGGATANRGGEVKSFICNR